MTETDEPDETLTPEAAAAVVEFARGCRAAAHAVSLYPPQHPAIAASLTRLVQATSSLTAQGPLDVRVRAQSLLVGEAAMPKADLAVSELAELLHRHLIGALTVNAGTDAASWRTLLLLLSRTPEDVRADGGIAHLWATAGGPSVEIREIDYAEVLREKQGGAVTIDRLIAAAMDGPQLQLDDDGLQTLLDLLGDSARVDELMARLDEVAGGGVEAKTAAVITLLRNVTAQTQKDTRTFESALRQLGHVAGRLSPDEMLQLIVQRATPTGNGRAVGAVLDRMDDGNLAHFVARSVIADHGATGRLAHAFQALIPAGDRQRQVLALAQERVAESDVGQDAGFEELWGRVDSMLTSYSDASYVSDAYGRELSAAHTRATDVERTNDDPPERIGAWLATVNDSALRALDHQLLLDLLAIELEPARWRDVAEAVAAHADDLVRVGYFDQAWGLADALIQESGRVPGRETFLPAVLERFGHGSMMKHVAAHLRTADDEAYARFERLCRAIGTPVIAPLAEALSTEQDARSRRRLRDVLIGFGAQGRDVVQQLMSASNWEVRRTAAFLLREFGGSQGLRELIPLLTDSEPLVQREAVQGLMLNGSDEAAAILLKALHASTGRSRQTLVNELTGVRDRRAAPLFCHLVRHLDRSKHPQVYLAAIESLGSFGDPDSVSALQATLHRGEWWAPFRTRRSRAAAAVALRRIGTAPALEVLRSAAASGDRGTRAAARAELAQLS